MSKKIWVNTLVKNEERYVWFAIKSVVDYIDNILVWDTGSTDKTVKIVKLLQKDHPNKIILKKVGNVDVKEFTKVRQQMLAKSKCDWVMILDGDEIWWDKSIKKTRNIIEERGERLDSLVHKYYSVVGDIYHHQEEKAGKYSIDGKVGHLNIRFFNRNIEGVHFSKPHGTQGIFDKDNVLIQERDKERRLHVNDYYMHFTHMLRSGSMSTDRKVPKRGRKYKYELGVSFSKDFICPEVFFKPRPNIVPSPWERMSTEYRVKAFIQTPLKKIKRKLFRNEKVGY